MRARQWYQLELRRSQRNVGAILALELSIEAAGIWARGVHQRNFVQYTRDYARIMRAACNGRPSSASSAHGDWLRTVDDEIDETVRFPSADDFTTIGRLCGVLRVCRQFFFSHTGSAYHDGWFAVRQMLRLAVEADLVDSEHQAFALWWHTLRCRLAFHDSARCVFV